MLKLVASLILLCMPSIVPAQTAGDRTAVVAAIGRWDKAWRTKDAGLATQDYTTDAHWVNAFGQRAAGRAGIERTLREVFARPFVAAGESTTLGHDVRLLGRNVAVVATTVERLGQLTPDGQPLGARNTSHLRVFHRHEGNWRIASHLISDARDRIRQAH